MEEQIEEAAALAAAGWAVAQISEKLGVHARTVYKWLQRRKKVAAQKDAPKRQVPADFERPKALAELIDTAILAAIQNPSVETANTLGVIARAAKALASIAAKDARKPYDDDARRKLLDKLNRAADNIDAQKAKAEGQKAGQGDAKPAAEGAKPDQSAGSEPHPWPINRSLIKPQVRKNPWFPDSWTDDKE